MKQKKVLGFYEKDILFEKKEYTAYGKEILGKEAERNYIIYGEPVPVVSVEWLKKWCKNYIKENPLHDLMRAELNNLLKQAKLEAKE